MADRSLRPISPPFLVAGPTGVSVRTRLKGLSASDEQVLRAIGAHLGSLASADFKFRCAEGFDATKESWAARKRAMTPLSSARWAGAITRASHAQLALARRAQAAHLASLELGMGTIRKRLELPVGSQGARKSPGGYRTKQEWHAKSRRLGVLETRYAAVTADRRVGRLKVVRGGKRLLKTRHNLEAAGISEPEWREQWEASRWFIAADGESAAPFGNRTISVSPDGAVSIRLPAPLEDLANSPRGRYVLEAKAGFSHRSEELIDRISANRAVGYRVQFDVERRRWYLTAVWQRAAAKSLSLEEAVWKGCIGVDANQDHLAAWRLDRHGNPLGEPRRFSYELTGTAAHSDAQIRHAITGLLHWATRNGVAAVAIENLGFEAEKTREKFGGNKRFRRMIGSFPTSKLRSRLASMAAEVGIAIIAVDPAYTSKWGAEHWQKPMAAPNRKTTRHDAASIVIGRRAQGFKARRRTAPPRTHQSDGCGHRTAQAGQRSREREESCPPETGTRTRCVLPDQERKRGTSASKTARGAPLGSTRPDGRVEPEQCQEP